MADTVGRSFTGTIVTRKEFETPLTPSLRRMLMVVVPDWLAAGVMVTLRVAPVPARTIFLTGTRAGLDEVAFRSKSSGGVSVSPIVKASGPMVVSSFAICPGAGEIDGG